MGLSQCTNAAAVVAAPVVGAAVGGAVVGAPVVGAAVVMSWQNRLNDPVPTGFVPPGHAAIQAPWYKYLKK